jgi:Flp pilus assembly protein TadG
MLLPRLKKAWTTESGVAAVEFAISAPLLVLLFVGFTEFSNLLYQQQQLEKSVRDAARYLSYYSSSTWTSPPGTICTSGNPTSYEQAAENLILYASPCAGLSPIVTGMTSNQITITSGSTTVTAPTGGASDSSCIMTIPTVTVSAETPYSDVIGLLPLLGLNNLTLSTSHEERVLSNTATESCT